MCLYMIELYVGESWSAGDYFFTQPLPLNKLEMAKCC